MVHRPRRPSDGRSLRRPRARTTRRGAADRRAALPLDGRAVRERAEDPGVPRGGRRERWTFEPRRWRARSVPSPGRELAGADNVHGGLRRTCVLCGECDTGCNVGAEEHPRLDLPEHPGGPRLGRRAHARARSARSAPTATADGGYVVRYVRHEHVTRAGPATPPHCRSRRSRRPARPRRGQHRHDVAAAPQPQRVPGLGRPSARGSAATATCSGSSPGPPSVPDRRSAPVIIQCTGPRSRPYGRRPAAGASTSQDAGYPEFLNWAWQVTPVPPPWPGASPASSPVWSSRGCGAACGRTSPASSACCWASRRRPGSSPMLAMGALPNGRLHLHSGRSSTSDWTMTEARVLARCFVRSVNDLKAAGARGHRRPLPPTTPYWWFKRMITTHPVGADHGRPPRRQRGRRTGRVCAATRGCGSSTVPTCRDPSARTRRYHRRLRPPRRRIGLEPVESSSDRSGACRGREGAPCSPGGGMKVAFQAGVLQVWLDEAGLTFDHVDGASGGVLNPAMLCQGLSGTEIADRWRSSDPPAGAAQLAALLRSRCSPSTASAPRSSPAGASTGPPSAATTTVAGSTSSTSASATRGHRAAAT